MLLFVTTVHIFCLILKQLFDRFPKHYIIASKFKKKRTETVNFKSIPILPRTKCGGGGRWFAIGCSLQRIPL